MMKNKINMKPVKNNPLSLDQTFIKPNIFIRIRKEIVFWFEHETLVRICFSILFTILTIMIGVLVVCLTYDKARKGACKYIFKRSMERAVGYNSRPRHVAVGDCNNDGYMDIVVANSGTDTIGVFLGFGNGTFRNQISISTGLGSRPYAVGVEYFNNDTFLDVVVANYGTNSLGVLLGYGNGSFANPIITSLGPSRPLALALEDFNNDSQLDIVVASYGTFDITILLGFNNGSFQMNTSYNMGYDSMPYSLVIADFNHDNKFDIATVNYGTSDLSILLSNSNRSFVMQKYSTGKNSHPCSVAVGDFNHDNHLDIVVANSGTNNIGIFLGNGNGTFHNMINQSVSIASHLQFIVVNDFTNDTHLDIVVIDSQNNNVIVMQGNGQGYFTKVTTHFTGYESNPSSIAMGDFDNDHIPDLIITNNATNDILVLIAYKLFPMSKQVTYSVGQSSNPNFIAVADFNKDNYSDIVVSNWESNSAAVFFNLGDGTFQRPIIYETGSESGPYCVCLGDVNNDKQVDIFILLNGRNQIQIFIGYGNGTFSDDDTYIIETEADPQTMVLGYLNDDNNIDIVVASSEAGIGVCLGYGNGTFTDFHYYLNDIQFYPKCIVLADLNNDTMLDIAASDFDNNGIVILLGDSDGSFNVQILLPIDDRPDYLAIGDINQDNYLDIVYVSSYYDNVGILLAYGNLTFGHIIRYPTGRGTSPSYVCLGHFNNDTLLDIAISASYGFNVGIFFGLENGSFSSQNKFLTAYNSYPSAIACADFNNDNQLDIAVTNEDSNNIGIFLIHYERDFTSESNYLTGSGPHPYSVAVGKFTRDNQSSIVVANSGNDNIQILLGYNEGVIMNTRTYSTGFQSYPQFVTIADFNNDHQLDVVVANNRNESISVFLGYDNGTFDTPSVHFTGSNSFPISIGIGDFNNDNWTDIVVANNGTNNLGVYLGFNYATFTNETIDISGPSSVPVQIVTGDFNNDDYYDILITLINLNMIGIYLGHGNGTFAEQIPLSTNDYSPAAIAIGHFNNDKDLDFVVTYNSQNKIGIFLGYGNGSFEGGRTYSTGEGSQPFWVAVGDFNRDNNSDLVVVNYDTASVGIFIGYGNGTFTEQISYPMPKGSGPRCVIVDDLNHDHNLDLIVANNAQKNIGIFFGYGNGTFRNIEQISAGDESGPYVLAAADINMDSWKDIVVAYSRGNISVFLGYGNGSFATPTTYLTGRRSYMYWLTVVDLNNDTKLDIVVAIYGTSDSRLGVLYGYGDGTFAVLKTYSTGWNSDPASIAIADFNNDRLLDLAVNHRNLGRFGIMLRQKSEPFASPTLLSTGDDSYPLSVTTGDFNNDQQLDIVVANSGTNSIGIFLGYGNGTFTEQQTFSLGNDSCPVSIAVGDINNDTYLDVIVANSKTNTVVILRGYGNGSIAVQTTYFTGTLSVPSSLAVHALNQDPYLDIVVANFGSNELLIFYGSINGTFLQPKSYALGYNARPQSVSIGDMNNDNLLDIVVANYGSDYVEVLLQIC